jgi:uncharacterized protein YlzI (FlbEa/FlbD family)
VSYDLNVWCVEAPESFESPAIQGRGWLVNATTNEVQAEDIPDEVITQLPGIKYVVELTLEGAAPKAALTAAKQLAKTIAKASRGIVEDPQRETFELPSGLKRFTPIKRAARAPLSLLELSWWFAHADCREASFFDRLFDVVARVLPEALPRRYGECEPPKHELAKTGRAHLSKFLVEAGDSMTVMYPTRPAVGVSGSFVGAPGVARIGGERHFRCNRFSIEVDHAMLSQPGWELTLERAWRAISTELRPFYGDVRTLHGHVWMGRTYGGDGESHPVRSWFWRGIPPRLGHAVVIGEPYLARWPQMQQRAESGLAFATTPSWQSTDDVADVLGGVPAKLTVGSARYAKDFPFATD